MVTRKALICITKIQKETQCQILDQSFAYPWSGSYYRHLSCRIVWTPRKNKFITMGTKEMQERKPRHKRSTTDWQNDSERL